MTKVLATGDTGRPTVERLLEKGFKVRALVRRDYERAHRLRDLGAGIVLGDLKSLREVRLAMNGARRAYFCFPLEEGLVETAVIFAQAAKEQSLELIVNMLHKQSRPAARSKATQNHWVSEQVFDWSGVPCDKESRFAPIAASDISRMVANLVEKPDGYVEKAIPLHGPVEYSHEELAAEVSRVLGKDMPYEHVTVSTFLECSAFRTPRPCGGTSKR